MEHASAAKGLLRWKRSTAPLRGGRRETAVSEVVASDQETLATVADLFRQAPTPGQDQRPRHPIGRSA